MAAPGDVHAPFDPRRQGGELVMALAGTADEDGMFDYFDKGFGKNWAGAEHWKLRKVSRKGASIVDLQASADPQTLLRPPTRRPRRLPKRLSRSISHLQPLQQRRQKCCLLLRLGHQYHSLPLPSRNGQARRDPVEKPRRGKKSGYYRTTCTLVVDSCYACSSSPNLR